MSSSEKPERPRASSPSGDKPRRMRLGTKSCAECRRRKIRCIVDRGSRSCRACILHDVPCRSQQAGAQHAPDETLQERVIELEKLVRRLYSDTSQSPSSKIDDNKSEEGSQQASVAPAENSQEPSALNSPLLQLFRNARLVDDVGGTVQEEPHSIAEDTSPTVLDLITARSIFHETRKYWPTWPTCYYGPGYSQCFQKSDFRDTVNYMLRVLAGKEQDPVALLTVKLWTALCVQQQSTEWLHKHAPNIDRHAFVTACLQHAASSLAVLNDTIDTVQCQILQHKLLINMGRPVAAWKATRSAVTTATALRLHLSGKSSEAKDLIWMQSWQAERQLSLILGYPSATLTMPERDLDQDAPLPYQILYRMSLISAQVITRDQDRHASYATTIKIDQDMEEASRAFPESWWAPPSSGLSLTEFYYLEVSKFLWFALQKLVHLPYMLKSIDDSRYEHSRKSALAAAREQIRSYVRLRNFPGAEVLMCELMDFVAFSAGVCLAVGSLYMPRGEGLSAFSEDGSLMESLIMTLGNVAGLLECQVAAQSAKVLRLLTERRSTDDSLEVAVPYFGIIKVNVPPVNVALSTGSMSEETLPTPEDMQAIEFSTCDTMGGVQMQFASEDELAADWFMPLDGDYDFDWQHTLNMSQMW